MDHAPKYTISRVAQLTGVRPATLRAWERRYGFPRPARTGSRYRLFSDADVAWIRWVCDRIAEGILPRQAVWLAQRRRAAEPHPSSTAHAPLQSPKEDLLAALMAFDGNRAEGLLRAARAAAPVDRVVRDVLLPAVAAIGAEWEAGRATVSQEHFASQLAVRYLSELLQGPSAPGPRLLCACAPGEQHQLGLMYVAAAARARRWHVLYLGADTPAQDTVRAAEQLRAQAVLVSCVVVDPADAWGPYRASCRRLARRGVVWLWGGPAAAGAARARLPGRVVTTLDAALEALDQLVRLRFQEVVG